MAIFSERRSIAKKFEEWAVKNNIAKNPEGLIAYLEIEGLLRTEKEKDKAEALKESAELGLMELSPDMAETLKKASLAFKREIAMGTKHSTFGLDICNACGKMVGFNAIYCEHCGQKLKEQIEK